MDANSQPTTGTADSPQSTLHTTRRRVLAASGAVALSGLAGCTAIDGVLNRAADAALGTTSASPAGFYSGDPALWADQSDGERQHLPSGTTEVRYVPAGLRARGQRVDLDGWITSTTTGAQNHNSSRSNRTRLVWVPDLDGDGYDDAARTLATVLDMERALSIHLDSAIAAVDARSAAEATASLDSFVEAVTEVRGTLDRCGSEVCVTVREHADGRRDIGRSARDAVDAGEWEEAASSLREARGIVDGDLKLIGGDLDSDGDGLGDGTEALYAYLDGDGTIGERFVVSLPDARLPNDGPALADELTPRRVLDYLIGEQGSGRCGEIDGPVEIHRDLACRNLLTATLAEETEKRRHVFATAEEGSVVVTGACPAVEESRELLRVSVDGTVDAPTTLRSWGDERTQGGVAASATFVCPVLATPPDCPSPMPALLYVRRLRHDDQYLYAGGWLLDDGALYEDSATLLVADGPAVLAGVTQSDIENGGTDLEALAARRKRPGRAKYGDIVLRRAYDPDDDGDILPTNVRSACPAEGHSYWAVQSRAALADGGGDCDDQDPGIYPACVVTALDAPILHLVDADAASNDVKFKAGAELSKAVN
ncbi:hypothetical protein [Halolamina sp. C58]|uniref:hypothetical protein n=1 Tax=Halolamina sp. C58 TaxID=3421640 RepID=UPI003EC14492